MRENVTELLKRLEDTQKGETICLKYDDVRKILRLLTDHGKTEITGNTLDTETILDGLDHMACGCEGMKCSSCRFLRKVPCVPGSCAMDGNEITENAARLIEDQAERIAIMTEHDVAPIRCKDCRYNCWQQGHETPSFWTPCREIKPEGHWFCWCGAAKDGEQE